MSYVFKPPAEAASASADALPLSDDAMAARIAEKVSEKARISLAELIQIVSNMIENGNYTVGIGGNTMTVCVENSGRFSELLGVFSAYESTVATQVAEEIATRFNCKVIEAFPVGENGAKFKFSWKFESKAQTQPKEDSQDKSESVKA